MTLVSSGYPGEVSKVEYSKYMRYVMYNSISGLSLSPSGSDRGIQVIFDDAVVPGVRVEQTAPDVVNAPANNSSFSRRDRIILRYDWGNNETTLAIKSGTPASNPQWPSTVRNPGVLWEQSVGRITVGPGMGAIPPENILATGTPQQSPLVVLDDESGLPFVSERVAVIDPATGRLRFSDGSAYRELLPGGDTPWESQAATTAWTDRGAGVIWRSRRAGVVHLRGALFRGDTGSVWLSDSHMFTLPAEWRPTQQTYGFCTQVFGDQQWFRLTVNSSDGQGIVRVAGDEAIRDTQMLFALSFPQF